MVLGGLDVLQNLSLSSTFSNLVYVLCLVCVEEINRRVVI